MNLNQKGEKKKTKKKNKKKKNKKKTKKKKQKNKNKNKIKKKKKLQHGIVKFYNSVSPFPRKIFETLHGVSGMSAW